MTETENEKENQLDEVVQQLWRIAEALEDISSHLESIIGETLDGKSFVRTLDIGRE